MRLFPALACVSLGCAPPAEEAPQPLQVELALHPPVLGLGTETRVTLRSTRSALVPGATELVLRPAGGSGPPLGIGPITVHDGFTAEAWVTVPEGALLGPYDAEIASERRSWSVPDALQVVPESIEVSPSVGRLGQLLELQVTGRHTAFAEGRTWASLGEAAQVLDVRVNSPTEASVLVSVHPTARPGFHDVAMTDGPHRVVRYDGFTVDRAAVTAIFDPPEVWQGDRVEFRIEGRDTTFLTDKPGSQVEFWERGGPKADLTVRHLEVLDATTIVGSLQVSNAAALGMRDVFISGFEDVLIPDALVVREQAPDLSQVVVGITYNVSRSFQAVSGAVLEDVTAQAYFLVPLDPPCTQPGNPLPGPVPYDVDVLVEVPEPPEPNDCPNPKTVSAGEIVWLEGPANTVPLYKHVIQSTGQIVYRGQDLTLADYHFNTLYDLRTEGDPDGIPAVLLPEVLPTVPADFDWLDPIPCCNATHPRSQDLPLAWTPAQTFPTAWFRVSLSGTMAASGLGASISSLPWDDGEHSFSASQLSYLAPGVVTLTASSDISGERFGLPGNLIQSSRGSSRVRYSGTLVLQ